MTVNRPYFLRIPIRVVVVVLAAAFVLGSAAIVVAANRGTLPYVITRLYTAAGA